MTDWNRIDATTGIPKPSPEYWYPALNRWHDQTGVSHTIKINEHGMAQPTCGAKVYSLGGGFAEPINSPCRRCLKASVVTVGLAIA